MSTKPPKLLEKEIEKKVCDYAKKKGFYVRKFTSPCARAVPDRLFITPMGKVFFIEFKRTGEKPTLHQLREHRMLKEVNALVVVVDNIPRGLEVIDAADRGYITQEEIEKYL